MHGLILLLRRALADLECNLASRGCQLPFSVTAELVLAGLLDRKGMILFQIKVPKIGRFPFNNSA